MKFIVLTIHDGLAVDYAGSITFLPHDLSHLHLRKSPLLRSFDQADVINFIPHFSEKP